MNKTWYAVYTKPRNEKKVAYFFERDGIDHYLPLIQRIKIWSDRKKKVDEPLFSSYIFVHIEEREHLAVLKTQGVVRFVTFEGKKVPIRDVQIEAIRKYAETGEELLDNEGDYTIGKKVKVARGGMKGLEGRLVEILGKQRVKVEIEAIGQAVFIQIPKGNLEIVGDYGKEEGRYW
ncbi:MAG: UpxY family transcription antiterminator [Bacteroidales bacterium]